MHRCPDFRLFRVACRGARVASRRPLRKLVGGDGHEETVPAAEDDMIDQDLHLVRHPVAGHPPPASRAPSAADHPAGALHQEGNQVEHGQHAGEGPGSMTKVVLEMTEFLQLPMDGILHRPAGAGTVGRLGDVVPGDGDVGGKGAMTCLLPVSGAPAAPSRFTFIAPAPSPSGRSCIHRVWSRRLRLPPSRLVRFRLSMRAP